MLPFTIEACEVVQVLQTRRRGDRHVAIFTTHIDGRLDVTQRLLTRFIVRISLIRLYPETHTVARVVVQRNVTHDESAIPGVTHQLVIVLHHETVLTRMALPVIRLHPFVKRLFVHPVTISTARGVSPRRRVPRVTWFETTRCNGFLCQHGSRAHQTQHKQNVKFLHNEKRFGK